MTAPELPQQSFLEEYREHLVHIALGLGQVAVRNPERIVELVNTNLDKKLQRAVIRRDNIAQRINLTEVEG